MSEPEVIGIVLAAGAGTRMGRPKALMQDVDGTSWLARSVEVVRAGGCDSVLVVLGAQSGSAAALLADRAAQTVVCQEWAPGLSASLRTGLVTVMSGPHTTALLHLVDLPDVGAEVVARLLAGAGTGSSTLARACYLGQPGHPVAVGRDHWPDILATATGDSGARRYLSQREVLQIECGDLATGRDCDHREAVRR